MVKLPPPKTWLFASVESVIVAVPPLLSVNFGTPPVAVGNGVNAGIAPLSRIASGGAPLGAADNGPAVQAVPAQTAAPAQPAGPAVQ